MPISDIAVDVMQHATTAASAIAGTLVGGLVTVWTQSRAARSQRRADQQRVAISLAVEIRLMIALIWRNGYGATILETVDKLAKGEMSVQVAKERLAEKRITLEKIVNRQPAFQAALPNIGQLGGVALNVAAFYNLVSDICEFNYWLVGGTTESFHDHIKLKDSVMRSILDDGLGVCDQLEMIGGIGVTDRSQNVLAPHSDFKWPKSGK